MVIFSLCVNENQNFDFLNIHPLLFQRSNSSYLLNQVKESNNAHYPSIKDQFSGIKTTSNELADNHNTGSPSIGDNPALKKIMVRKK